MIMRRKSDMDGDVTETSKRRIGLKRRNAFVSRYATVQKKTLNGVNQICKAVVSIFRLRRVENY